MTAGSVLPIVLAWLVAIASPGPDLLMILRQSSRRNGERTGARARGLAAALGIMTGNLAWMTGAALGLGAVVALVPAVLPVLKILGGAFLVWMGVSGLRGPAEEPGPAEAESAEPTEAEAEPSQPLRRVRPDAALTSRSGPDRRTDRPGAGPGSGTGAAYVTGIATNLANPKALIFFTALFAPFMSGGWPLGEVALLLGVLLVTGVAWFCGFALLVTSATAERWVGRHWGLIERVTSALFVLLGAGFLINGLVSLLG